METKINLSPDDLPLVRHVNGFTLFPVPCKPGLHYNFLFPIDKTHKFYWIWKIVPDGSDVSFFFVNCLSASLFAKSNKNYRSSFFWHNKYKSDASFRLDRVLYQLKSSDLWK